MSTISYRMADLSIQVACNQLPILQVADDAYLTFITEPPPEVLDIDLRIELHVAEADDVRSWHKTYDDDHSCSIYRHDDEYAICYAPKVHGTKPLWVAKFSYGCEHVQVFCSERYISKRNGQTGVLNPFRYPLDQHLMMFHLARKRGLIIHAAGFIYADVGIIFPGQSGGGKSTITRHLSGHPGWQALSDDRIIIRGLDDEIFSYGTPWPGEEGVAINKSVELAAILFLRHGDDNRLAKMSAKEGINKLMPVVSIPWYDRRQVDLHLQFCTDILSQIPIYEFSFRPTDEVATFLDQALVSEKIL